MNFRAKAVRTVAAAGLALVMTTSVAFASIGTATVAADNLRLRSAANTSSSTVTMAPRGSTVTVEEDAGNGWYKVTYGSQTGYMSGEWLTVSLSNGTVIPAAQGTASTSKKSGLVTASVLNVRSGAGTGYAKVGSLKSGAVVNILADLGNGWYQIDSGYVSAEYITLVDGNYSAASSLGTSAANLAKSLVGHPISRIASSQYYNNGYFVSTSAMQPGDLIFFFDRRYDSSGGTLPVTHVGIYVGNGQFVHASSPSTGVKYDSIYGYFAPYIVGAKRIG